MNLYDIIHKSGNVVISSHKLLISFEFQNYFLSSSDDVGLAENTTTD